MVRFQVRKTVHEGDLDGGTTKKGRGSLVGKGEFRMKRSRRGGGYAFSGCLTREGYNTRAPLRTVSLDRKGRGIEEDKEGG